MEKGFEWHKVSEEEKKKIQKEAKNLLDEFALKIKKIETKESHFENNSGFREEGNSWNTNPEFKDIIFLNAPFIEDDSIVAEKGEWK
jgi:hypothetical protein